ncbi:MAG: chromosome segregation protein SMC [Streptosporangiales bacterium]|nr:chromosome segregation protein SMC [Streptosporangiales bacterium]
MTTQERRRRAGGRARARRLGFSAPAYVGQARRALAEAVAPEPGTSPALRYSGAHLAALRSAAAVLAVRGRPSGRRAGTAWTELAEVAPELEEWSAVFAQSAGMRATADAGLPFPLSHRDVDAFCELVDEFLGEVEELIDLGHQAVLPTAS